MHAYPIRQVRRRKGEGKEKKRRDDETYTLPKTATRLVARPLYCTAPMLVLVRGELGVDIGFGEQTGGYPYRIQRLQGSA